MSDLNNLQAVLNARLEKAITQLPKILGEHAVNFSKDRFEKGGWQNETFEPWKQRSSNAVRNKDRAILVDSARLKRSIGILEIGKLQVVFGSKGVPYAKAHNYGFKGSVLVKAHKRNKFAQLTAPNKIKYRGIVGNGQVKAHTRNMNIPQRKFLGNSIFLQRQLQRIAQLHIARTLKA